MKIINLFGGPGTGKSTTAAGLFYKMKMAGLNVELITEYAKDLTWDERIGLMLDQQEYLFAKQNQRQHRLRGKVDWAITDSPLLLSTVYPLINQQDPDIAEWDALPAFVNFVRHVNLTYDTHNIFLNRPPDIPYSNVGRTHTAEQSNHVAELIKDELFDQHFFSFDIHEFIVEEILSHLSKIFHDELLGVHFS